ncbi:histidine phosphatase family protein [Saccharopolyspora taberi]|uniref:Histidine phosphatase family protein n=1 Tax=Saccharopolyspora taberi TaxID=60895 RepID=A0ABN3VEW8_9PSEU
MVFLRHGHSQKNALDRHGGPGLPLTGQGRDQVRDVAKELASSFGTPSRVFFCDRVHIEETARLLADSFGVAHDSDERIRPMGLGVLDGLSRAEAAEKYPEAADSLQRWRELGRGLERLNIPLGEDFESFRARTESFVAERCAEAAAEAPYTITVTSNSTIIMLVNIAEHGVGVTASQYRNVITANAEYTVFDTETVACGKG